ncbi:hypothetical protein BC629DRAFT_769008 [Irpex lacteus]|nr:hypothetical protein BC629DRAFT_769008 [Irpex lacteus]
MPRLDLSNTDHFPSLHQLPNDAEANFTYYHETPAGSAILLPSRHWVFLCEIVQNITFMRPHYLVKDRSGTQTQVVFYLEGENTRRFASIREKFVVGHTIAVFYADSHHFVDGSFGLRVEDVSTVKMIPCPLAALLSSNTAAVAASKACSSCGAEADDMRPALQGCSRCKTRYCNTECQRVDWKRHKPSCLSLQQVRAWEERDWNHFADYWDAF